MNKNKKTIKFNGEKVEFKFGFNEMAELDSYLDKRNVCISSIISDGQTLMRYLTDRSFIRQTLFIGLREALKLTDENELGEMLETSQEKIVEYMHIVHKAIMGNLEGMADDEKEEKAEPTNPKQ